jgi:hypothetical protein
MLHDIDNQESECPHPTICLGGNIPPCFEIDSHDHVKIETIGSEQFLQKMGFSLSNYVQKEMEDNKAVYDAKQDYNKALVLRHDGRDGNLKFFAQTQTCEGKEDHNDIIYEVKPEGFETFCDP